MLPSPLEKGPQEALDASESSFRPPVASADSSEHFSGATAQCGQEGQSWLVVGEEQGSTPSPQEEHVTYTNRNLNGETEVALPYKSIPSARPEA